MQGMQPLNKHPLQVLESVSEQDLSAFIFGALCTLLFQELHKFTLASVGQSHPCVLSFTGPDDYDNDAFDCAHPDRFRCRLGCHQLQQQWQVAGGGSLGHEVGGEACSGCLNASCLLLTKHVVKPLLLLLVVLLPQLVMLLLLRAHRKFSVHPRQAGTADCICILGLCTCNASLQRAFCCWWCCRVGAFHSIDHPLPKPSLLVCIKP